MWNKNGIEWSHWSTEQLHILRKLAQYLSFKFSGGLAKFGSLCLDNVWDWASIIGPRCADLGRRTMLLTTTRQMSHRLHITGHFDCCHSIHLLSAVWLFCMIIEQHAIVKWRYPLGWWLAWLKAGKLHLIFYIHPPFFTPPPPPRRNGGKTETKILKAILSRKFFFYNFIYWGHFRCDWWENISVVDIEGLQRIGEDSYLNLIRPSSATHVVLGGDR